MIEVIRNLHDLGELVDEWNLLPGAQQNPLFRHEWFLSSAEAFYDEKNLRVITIRENGRLRAVAPLVLVKRHGIHRLELLGASFLHEPSDLLYDSEDSLMELSRIISRLSISTILQRVAQSSTLTDQITKQSHGRGKLLKYRQHLLHISSSNLRGNIILIRFHRAAATICDALVPNLKMLEWFQLSLSVLLKPSLRAICKKPFVLNRPAGKDALARR